MDQRIVDQVADKQRRNHHDDRVEHHRDNEPDELTAICLTQVRTRRSVARFSRRPRRASSRLKPWSVV